MSRSNFGFLVNNQKALRHFNLVGTDKTSVLAIFCVSKTTRTIQEIQKVYPHLAAFFHHDRSRIDVRHANCSMRTLAHTMEIFQTNFE